MFKKHFPPYYANSATPTLNLMDAVITDDVVAEDQLCIFCHFSIQAGSHGSPDRVRRNQCISFNDVVNDLSPRLNNKDPSSKHILCRLHRCINYDIRHISASSTANGKSADHGACILARIHGHHRCGERIGILAGINNCSGNMRSITIHQVVAGQGDGFAFEIDDFKIASFGNQYGITMPGHFDPGLYSRVVSGYQNKL